MNNSIPNNGSEEGAPKKDSAKPNKRLIYEGSAFARKSFSLGEPTMEWIHADHKSQANSNVYPVEIDITGVDLLCGIYSMAPLFAHDLLQDGSTDFQSVEELSVVMTKEIYRLTEQLPNRVSATFALFKLRHELRALYDLGYTLDELVRLLKGSLRTSITTNEIIDAMLADSSDKQ